MKFYYGPCGSLLCDEQVLESWREERRGEPDTYAPEDGPEVLYFVAESMMPSTARLIAAKLGGEFVNARSKEVARG